MKCATSSENAGRRAAGFGLVELLMVVAILGIMASLAVSVWGANHDVFETARAKRNAQELAAECYKAAAAGLDFVVEDSVEKTAKNVVRGGAPASGAFKGRPFGLPTLTERDLEESTRYLEMRNGVLAYNPEL